VLRAGLDEERVALGDAKDLTPYLEHATSLEHDVDLVVLVRLLRVGLGRDEYVHSELEPWRPVHDLVTAAAGGKPLLHLADREGVSYAPSSVASPALTHAFRPPSSTLTLSYPSVASVCAANSERALGDFVQ
jgi:hypothetical protein